MHLQTQTERSDFYIYIYLQTFTTALIPHLLSSQYECGAASSAVVHSADGKQLEVGGAAGSTVKDLSEIKDVSEMKMLVSGLSFSVFQGSAHPNCTKKLKKIKVQKKPQSRRHVHVVKGQPAEAYFSLKGM